MLFNHLYARCQLEVVLIESAKTASKARCDTAIAVAAKAQAQKACDAEYHSLVSDSPL